MEDPFPLEDDPFPLEDLEEDPLPGHVQKICEDWSTSTDVGKTRDASKDAHDTHLCRTWKSLFPRRTLCLFTCKKIGENRSTSAGVGTTRDD